MTAEEFIEQMQNDHDEYELIDDYLYRQNARKPPKYIGKFSSSYDEAVKEPPSNELKPGDITRLLQNVPGILGYANEMQKSVDVYAKQEQPDMITTESIPIFLNEKYFRTPVNPTKMMDSKVERESDNGQKSRRKEKKSLNDFLPTIYASNAKKEEPANKDRSVNGGTEFYTPFEIYQLKRVSWCCIYFTVANNICMIHQMANTL